MRSRSALEAPRARPARDAVIGLHHGAGGSAMRALIQGLLAAGFEGNGASGVGLAAMDDGAALPIGDRWLVITTDSHVVQPAFFPGGDIGRLAVAGTVNDLAMMGATEPLGLTSSIVLEEGFPRERLERVLDSMRRTCREAATTVLTGDTKVMGRGEVDGIVLNTTGIGLTGCVITDSALRPGDRIVVTGTMGDHGLAVMTARRQLRLEGELLSDVAPINGLVRAVLAAAPGGVAALKDPTRGGLASALHEMAAKSGVGILILEQEVPLSPQVRAAGELLGIDPLHVANEGKAVIGVRPEALEAVLAALRGHPLGRDAAVVGSCTEERPGQVVLETGFGRRLLTEPAGEPLPRIC